MVSSTHSSVVSRTFAVAGSQITRMLMRLFLRRVITGLKGYGSVLLDSAQLKEFDTDAIRDRSYC
jgi:hypothetical protein